MRFVPLSEIEPQEQTLQFFPLQAEPPPAAEPVVSPEELAAPPGGFVTPGGAVMVPPRMGRRPPSEGATAAAFRDTSRQRDIPPAAPAAAAPTGPELRPWEPTLWERFLNLFPGDRAKAANEALARRIAKEKNISVDEAYRQMKEALGVRGVMGTRPSGQPMFNPEGRAPIKATTEAVPYVVEGILDIPKGMAEAALRAYRAGDIDSTIDTGYVDRTITYLGNDAKDIFIPNLPERMGLRRDDPNYQGFMGLGKSLGYSLTTMVASAITGAGATAATGNPIVGVGAGMATSGTLAYRASKDDFLDRLRTKLNDDSKRVFGRALSAADWNKAKKEFNAAAVEYGAWEAIPEAISNAIFLRAFAAPVKGAPGAKLAGYIQKANSFAAENLTETATGMGQNAAELKAGLTQDEITVADAFKQQFIQTAITMGVMGGGMKGKDLAVKFYNEQVLPKIDPASALAKAIKADIDAVAFSPQAIKQEAAFLARTGAQPRTLEELARQRPVAPTPPRGAPAGGEPPEEPAAPPPAGRRVEPEMGEPTAGPEAGGRIEPSVDFEALPPSQGAEPSLTFVPLAELDGRAEPTFAISPEEEALADRILDLESRQFGLFTPDGNPPRAGSPDRKQFDDLQNQIADARAELFSLQTGEPLTRLPGLASPREPRAPGAREVPTIPGMPTGEELAEQPAPVTPVTPAPAVVQPTPAAAALPETPTVPPVTKPKTFEPTPPQHMDLERPIVGVPVKDLKLSEDVPQFKYGANKKGVVEPLGGKFTTEGVAPIAVWQRLDGSLEVISGRHRFDLAQRSGTETIPAQIYYENQGFTAMDAAIKDAELNIRDDQGKVKDYVNYFRESGTDRQTAESKGFLARDKGKRGFTIANQGSDELIDSLRADQVGDEAAFYIALNAPNDARLQGVGIKAVMDGKSANTAVNMMQAVKALAGEQDTTTDMFGFDDSAMREAEEMAKIAARKQREIQTRLSAISGAAKNPAVARAEGIDIKDPEAVKRRIDELRQRKAAWDNWSTSPELIAEIRSERGVAPPMLTPVEQPTEPLLTAQTPEELRERAEREAAEAKRKSLAEQELERKERADRARDEFVLTGSDRPADEAAARGQEDLFAAPPAAAPAPSVDRNVIGVMPNGETRLYREQDGIAPDDLVQWKYSPNAPAKVGRVERVQDAFTGKGGFAAQIRDQQGGIHLVDTKQLTKIGTAPKIRDVVNNKQPSPTLPAENRLVLMPCCDMKGPEKAPAMELYKGVFFQTFKGNVKDGARPNVVILSAKHGFISPTEEIEPYDQVMDKARADEMLGNIRAQLKGVDFPRDIKDVLIVGGKEYQRVMRAAVSVLQDEGVISIDASVNATSGGIGDQRKQLGEYLRSIEAKQPARKGAPATAVADAQERTISMTKAQYREDEATRGQSTSAAMGVQPAGMTPKTLLDKHGEKNVRLLARLYGVEVKDKNTMAKKLIDLFDGMATMDGYTKPQLESMTLAQLKPLANEIGTSTNGSKAEIIRRLMAFAPNARRQFEDRLQDLKHRAAITNAVRQGKEIADEVLKDYPELVLYARERGSDMYNKAARDMALKMTSDVRGMDMQAEAENLRQSLPSIEDPKERQVTEDVANAIDALHQKMFGEKAAEPGAAPDEEDPGVRGASDEEVSDVADAFQNAKQAQDADTITRVFDAPKKADIVRIEEKARIFVKDSGYLTVEQAKQRIEEWKRNAQAQGDTRRNSEKIVLSLFDMTGEWSKPWEEAGYQVFRFDIQTDPEMGDVNKFSAEFFNDLYGAFEGQDIYAILAACPCTDFASSGARHFAAKDADGRTVESVELVKQTLATVEYFKPSVWAIENPVGRIEKLTGLPPWRLSFNPNHFGDPYTKKTLLWGRFNANLPIAPVEPVEGSKMHRMYGGKSQETKNARSVTPEGFAYAFFQANNAVDNPVMALANKYDMMSPEVFREAVAAGMSDKQVADVVDDPYYFYTDYQAADRALLDAVERMGAAPVSEQQIKNEAEFVETVAKDAMERMAGDFMVGDQVRFGNTPGVVIGLEGDYVRFRPDAAKSPKAYQRVLKSSLTFVARPDVSGTSAYSKAQDNKFGEEAGQLNADMGNLIQLLGANMYAANLADVSVKELLQNAFDAVKGAVSSKKAKSLYTSGSIEITLNTSDRTISIKDNARGMTPQIVRDAFFTVAGSEKSDLDPSERSGGLGLAKMGFMLGADRLQLDTVRDGVRVTVDTTAKDIANNNFKIVKSPAPKGEHGTTVTVKIPEKYIDPKTGEAKDIWFPWGLDYIDPLNKPLIGPVEVKVKMNSYGDTIEKTLPVGVNFPEDKFQKFKANFEWGSADIYFGVERKLRGSEHRVLSSGVYQFDDRFQIGNERIPYDIIINVKPNVDARHPDYPFENSRERFKGRLKKDIESLTAYLGQISRGYEAAGLQESFKGIVSMPRVEAGAEIAGVAEKLKKTFGTQGAEAPAELKPLPKEVSITPDAVTDAITKQVLLKIEKAAEKEKESTFAGEKAPQATDFLIELKQDPKLPIFHNNTNVDYLEIGRQYGEPEKFFAELGTLIVEMKEDLAKSGIYGYDVLAPDNLFFGGVSIDKEYGGLHLKVPYKAVFLNPFYDWGARTLFGVRQNFLNTMIHELAHTGSMDHGVAHNNQMIKVEQYLSDEGLIDYYRDAILDVLRRHESAFTAMREAYGQSTTRNTAKSLEAYQKDAGATSARGGAGGPEYTPTALSERVRQGRGAGVPEAEAAGREGEVGAGAGATGFIEVDGVQRPIANSNGQRIHPTDAGLRNFWRWFGDSQVVDAQGRPLVVYHGTGFTQAGDAIVSFQMSAGLYGAGAYFSGNPERAANYAKAGQGTVYPVYVRLVNPISVDDYIERFEGTTRSDERAWDARQELLNDGVDGVLSEPRGPTRFWEVVAFNENQIKSAIGNLGTFNPDSPSIIQSIEPASIGMAEEPYSDQDVLDSEQLRKERIKEYATLRAQLARVPKEVAAGRAGLEMQETVARLLDRARNLQFVIKATKPRRDSAEQFLAKALTEYDAGNISADVLEVIQAAYAKTPDLLEGLLLRVRAAPKGGRAAGDFVPWQRIIRLYKGTSGVDDPATIRHELAHTLEQMMTPEQRMAVVQAWGKALSRAIKQNPDELHQKYFNAVLDFLDNPTDANYRKAQAAMPSYEMYQFINPSEFWAVNAEKLMAAQLGGAWDKFKRAVRRMWEGVKNVLGFDNRSDIHKVFNQVIGGSRERLGEDMLVDMVSATGGKFVTLENIEDDKKLVEKYNRPKTPMLNTKPIATFVNQQFKNGKEFVQDAVANPREAMVGAGDSVMDGLIYLRNKNVWYGSGLEARDFDQYNGELRTSEGIATASVALDNAIRSGNIGVEVIFRGGIEYDTKSNNFVAVNRRLGMKGVYEAESALKKKLGDQLGTDIIQGYLEAKRSISIMDELYDREAAFEAAKDTLKMLRESGADPEDIAQAKAVAEALATDVDNIKKAVSSVNMSEDEMYEFAALDQKHPELRQIMDDWTAVNQNLLKFWRQVGLISQGRYETLAAIKDYVPWYRIMADEEDVHSPLQSTTRALTNIGREKLFKRGKPIAVVDFRATAGQKDFKIQPSSVVKVEVNGKPVSDDLVSVAPDGQVRLDMDLEENDLVVFKTNREIENIIDNMTRNVMRMTMNGIRQFAANRIVMEYGSRNANGKIMTFPSVDKEKGRFNWIVNGKKVVVEIQDPLVAASIYGMENLNLQMWKPLAMVANLTRRSITLSGVFQLKQVFKDAPTAALVTGVKNPLALIGGVWKGFLTSLTNTDPAVDILKAAGIGGFHSPARTPEAEIKRRLGIMNRNVFSALIKGLDHIGDASDMAQRVAVYKRVLAETGDETRALFQAANVINFLHHGSAGYAQAAVKVVPFLGAYANAMDVLVRALVGGGLKGMSRKKALARLGITMSMLVSLSILYAMLAGGDPEYDELDDQTKLKNIIIPGTKIMLPMNTSAAYFFKAIPELIYNVVTREGTENEMDRRRIRKALADAARDMLLGPEPIPAGVKPVLEVAINHDFFTGRTVIPEGLKDVQAAEQYTATTSELGKKLSAMLAIPGTDGKRVLSPIEADHIIRGVFGTAGAMGQWISNSIGTIAETRPEPSAREAPITGSFLRDEVPRGREDLFYDFKDVVFEKYKTWQKMIDREDFDAADAYLAKHGDVAAMYEYINETEAELKDINAEIRRLGETRSKDQTPKERREQIDEFKRLRNEILDPVKELRREVLQ